MSARTAVFLALGSVALAAACFGATPAAPVAPVAALVARTDRAGLPHSTAAVTIDGRLGDAIWQEALVFELDVQTFPGENTPPPVETHAYLVEDGARLLIAFDARDPDPGAIRAYFRDRDAGYKLNPQTVLFVGYSDNAREDEDMLDLARTDRTVFAKVSYAWMP